MVRTLPKAIYGIIGNPVAQSLSPLMHNAAFKALGAAAEYKLFPLKEEELKDFFLELKQEDSGIFGLNVTVPYKETVIPYLDSLSPYAQKAMTVNTIVISPKRQLEGFNTDGAGFLAHLLELGFDPKGKRIAILGAGGTARAIVSVLCLMPQRPHSIRIYNRHPQKAEQLITDLKNRIGLSGVEAVLAIDDLNIELADLLINTTPVGLKNEKQLLVEPELIHRNLLVYDVIYNPPETPLLAMARGKGAKTANGLGMLFYQGVLSFQHWAEIELDAKTKKKMRESLTQKGK